jgi:hypothetical protein
MFKQLLMLLCLCSILFVAAAAEATPIIWTGPTITFTKASSADWTLPENQDRITDDTWITRANNYGIFNIKSETAFTYPEPSSPFNTEWSLGSAADYASLTFYHWNYWQREIVNGGSGNPSILVGKDSVLHLIAEDIYIDVKMLSWASGGGGGFSYERSTLPEPATVSLLVLGGLAMLRRRK